MRWLGAALVAVVIPAGCLFDDPTGPSTTGSTSAATEPTSGFGTAGECNQPPDCPPVTETCKRATCVGGACGSEFIPAGQPGFDEMPGDCYLALCDGAGKLYTEPGDDVPFDKGGDCQRFVCDAGNILTKIDDSDTPSDGNDCTDDACDMGTPTYTPRPQDSPCGPLGDQFCHSDQVCRRCKQVTDACEDFGGEPHENQETAFDLGEISDNDADGSFVCGTLKGANDVDWYTFGGKDAFGNYVDPLRSLVTQNGDGAQVCVFFECTKGSTTVDCKSATPTTAPLGQKGCCAGKSVGPKLDCSGLDDTARVWIRVGNPQMLACIPYELDYHF